MLERFGATEKLLAQGLIAPTFQYRDRATGEKLGEFDFGALADVVRHPYRLQCEQFKLNFKRWPEYLDADRPTAAVRFGAEGGRCASRPRIGVTVHSGRRGEAVAGTWLVIGADGARSAVRQGAGHPV